MTIADPFAAAPAADEAQNTTTEETTTQEAPISTTATVTKSAPSAAVGADGKVVLTFKGGSGFDAPWVVIHADGIQEAHEFVTGDNASLLAQVMERVQSAAKHFAGMGSPAPQAGGGNRGGGGAPAAAQSAPGGETRHCAHGEMVFKSGVSKAGKPYKLFSCTAPRDQQCKAQFLN